MALFGPPDIKKLKEKKNVKGLIRALSYKDIYLQQQAARELGNIGDPQAVKALLAVLGHMQVGPDAALALGKIGDKQAVEPLMTSLEEWRKMLRKPEKPSKYSFGIDYERFIRLHVTSTATALGQIGDLRAVEPLIATLNNPDPKARKAVCSALAQLGDKRAVDALISVMQNWGSDSVSFAVDALIQLGDPKALPTFISLMDQPNTELRSKAIEALEKFGWQPEKDRSAAIYWINKNNFEKCLAIGAPALKPLMDALEYLEGDALTSAISALGGLGDERSIKPMIALMKHKDWSVRRAAVKALNQFGAPEEALKPLLLAIKDVQKEVRTAAAELLAKYDDPKAIKALDSYQEFASGYKTIGKMAKYILLKTSLGNPLYLEVKTEKLCVYCNYLMDPNLRDYDYPKGVGECSNYSSGKNVVSFDDSCELWQPNTKVRFWLSKGYMEHNLEGWPRNPWYQLFDDGPDGEKGTH